MPVVPDAETLTIGRFARLTGLTAKALRHYDAQGLLRPREVDPVTGYRRYGTEQVERGRLIRRLRELDVPLEVVRDALASHDGRDDEKARAMLGRHLANVDAELSRHQRTVHHLRMLLGRQELFAMDTTETHDATEQDERRRMAVDLFNDTWSLMERRDRSADDDLRMLHMAHASRFLWGEVGEPQHRARGEWQVSRVNTVLGRPDPAMFHARACLRICEEHGIGDWDIAFAHEAVARAAMVAGDATTAASHLARARELGERIADPEDRNLLEQDLATIVP